MMVSRVILLRTSHLSVIEAVPNFVASNPISIMSPFFALARKSISLIYLVTVLGFSN